MKDHGDKSNIILDLESTKKLKEKNFRYSKLPQILPEIGEQTKNVLFPYFSPPTTGDSGHYTPVQLQSGKIRIIDDPKNFSHAQKANIEEDVKIMHERIFSSLPGPSTDCPLEWIKGTPLENDCGPKCLFVLENLSKNKEIVTEPCSEEAFKMHYSLMVQDNACKVAKSKKAVRKLHFES